MPDLPSETPDPTPSTGEQAGNTPPEPPAAQLPVGGSVDLAIERELADSYLSYAMSTIVDRALPDVRDGLKPSQRRILMAMNDLNLRPGAKHRKCAKICGDTSGNYHPHGESVIYPALVNMAQDWKMRHVLIDKQGNFGSIDPDPPAAMRYTEARMAGPAADLLDDLKLDTVDWQDNYDATRLEPRVLPGKFPNLLVNGAQGIAVGMATSMAPHNLGEICDAITEVIDNPGLDLAGLMRIVPGPDFPTGGRICGRRGVYDAYATGRGRVTVRAKIDHETTKSGRTRLVVKEIPYHVSKNDGVIDKIKAAKAAERLADVSGITDESSGRAGMRLVIECKQGADPQVVENQLYQVTPLQSTFSIINIALVNGQPRTLGLRELIDLYIEHREDVVRRRTRYRLKQAQIEAHRIEGLIYAVVDIDEVIRLIRSSQTREEAIERLMARGFRIPADHPQAPKIPARFRAMSEENAVRLTRVQAESIGRLQLIQLVGLEIEQLVENYSKLLAQIEEFEDILGNPGRVSQIIKDEVAEMRRKYADPRRTVIEEGEVGDLDIGALTPVEQVVVTITRSGYVKRLPVEQYRVQARGGRGVIGAKSKTDDFTSHLFVASTHDDLLCFTDTGRVFKIKVYEIPEAPRNTLGRPIINLLNLQAGETIREFMPIADFEKGEYYLVFCSEQGIVKRTALADYRNVHSGGINAVNLREGDRLIGVTWTGGNDHLILGTRSGMAIRFDENDARVMGRAATGVKGIDLAEGDAVVGLVKVGEGEEADLLTLTARGYGKRTSTVDYLVQPEEGEARAQSRGGKGRRDIKVGKRNGDVIALLQVTAEDHLMLITRNGLIVRIAAGDIRQVGRNTQGVRVVNVSEGDDLVAVARVADTDEEAEEGEGTVEEVQAAIEETVEGGMTNDE